MHQLPGFASEADELEEHLQTAKRYERVLRGSNGIIKHINQASGLVQIKMPYRDYMRETTRRIQKLMLGRGFSQAYTFDMLWHVSCFVQEGLYRLGNETGAMPVQYMDSVESEQSHITYLSDGMSSVLKPLKRHFHKDTVKLKAHVKSIDFSFSSDAKAKVDCIEPYHKFNGFGRDRKPPLSLANNNEHGKSIMDGNAMKVQIDCSDGRVFSADHVIITMPLGHLKMTAVDIFHPPLPDKKMKAIRRLGFGSVSKVLLHYSELFWEEPFRFLHTDDYEIRSHDYDSSNTMCSKKVLIFTAGDKSAVVTIATVGTYLDDVCDRYLKMLVKTIMSSYLKSEVPDPYKITRGRWSTNPLFRGTHPFMTSTASPEDIKELAAPVCVQGRPTLLFAGDATYENYTSLIHAARASGLREATRLEIFYDETYKYKNQS